MLKDNQPDLIFVSDTIGKDMLTTNENYSGLKAVKDGKINVVKTNILNVRAAGLPSF